MGPDAYRAAPLERKNPIFIPSELSNQSGLNSSRSQPQGLQPGMRIVAGRSGDHFRVMSLLRQAYQHDLANDFQSHLDEPAYEPADRLLVTSRGGLVGHLQVLRQSTWFEEQRIPVAAFRDTVVMAEFQGIGLLKSLLERAEIEAEAGGAVLALARPEDSTSFAARGWSCFRGQGFTQANTRTLMAHVSAGLATRRHRFAPLEVRTWWHYELDAIRPIFEEVGARLWGTQCRSEETWRWLVGRKSHDQILIAIDHRSELAIDRSVPPVVGYAVVRDARLVEIMCLPEYPAVPALLVARICQDAIDQDHHSVTLHAPASDPLHELLVTAEGSWITQASPAGGEWWVKLLSPERWVDRLSPRFLDRARSAGIPRPMTLTLAVEGRHYELVLTRRSLRLNCATATAHPDVACNAATFQDLLLSNLDIPEAIRNRWLRVSDKQTTAILAGLFPPRYFWQSHFELLRI